MTLSRSRGVLLVLLVAGVLWGISLASWQAGAVGERLGPAGVANLSQDAPNQASPVTTSCVAIIAVCGLLSAMLSRVGRYVVLGIAAIADIGYGATALAALGRPGATAWPVGAIAAAFFGLVAIVLVLLSSSSWTNSNRYSRGATAGSGVFDATATWDALSRGDEIESTDEVDGASGEADEPNAVEADELGTADGDVERPDSPRSTVRKDDDSDPE